MHGGHDDTHVYRTAWQTARTGKLCAIDGLPSYRSFDMLS